MHNTFQKKRYFLLLNLHYSDNHTKIMRKLASLLKKIGEQNERFPR